MQLKIYGKNAKQIKEGQTFIAKITSVEGRTVLVLEYKYIEGLDNQPCPRCESTNTWYDIGDNDECHIYDNVICRDCGCNT